MSPRFAPRRRWVRRLGLAASVALAGPMLGCAEDDAATVPTVTPGPVADAVADTLDTEPDVADAGDTLAAEDVAPRDVAEVTPDAPEELPEPLAIPAGLTLQAFDAPIPAPGALEQVVDTAEVAVTADALTKGTWKLVWFYPLANSSG